MDPLKALLSAQILKQGPSISAQRQRAEEGLMGSTDAGGNFDPRGMDSYLQGEARAAESDPFSERYRQIGDAQTEAAVFNEPTVAAARGQQQQDALQRVLAPIHARGQYDLERQALASQGQVQAAQAQGVRTNNSQKAQMQRAQVAQRGQMQRQQNQLREAQAKQVEKTPRGFWETILPVGMGGKPSPAEQAAEIRGQQNFELEPEQDETIQAATEFAESMMGASDEEILAALQAEFDADDPSEYLEVLAAIREIQGQ